LPDDLKMEDENDFSSDSDVMEPEEISVDFGSNIKPKTNGSYGATSRKNNF
jgi:hypothetical protein